MPKHARTVSIQPETTIQLATDLPFDHSPRGWAVTLGRKPDQTESAWLSGFTLSKAGNITRKGFITDNKTDGSPSLPFRLTIFKRKDYTNLWNYIVGVDENDGEYKIFGNEDYPDPFIAALAVRIQLKDGGFTIETGPMLATSLRVQFRKRLREERGVH